MSRKLKLSPDDMMLRAIIGGLEFRRLMSRVSKQRQAQFHTELRKQHEAGWAYRFATARMIADAVNRHIISAIWCPPGPRPEISYDPIDEVKQ